MKKSATEPLPDVTIPVEGVRVEELAVEEDEPRELTDAERKQELILILLGLQAHRDSIISKANDQLTKDLAPVNELTKRYSAELKEVELRMEEAKTHKEDD